MNKRVVAFFAILAVLLVVVLVAASRPVRPPKREAVAVTVFPLYDLVRNMTPDDVEVILLLPPGASPHTFEPTPSTVKALERSKVLFAFGHGVDDWIIDVALATDTPVVNNYSGIELREYGEDAVNGHDEDADDYHEHEGTDPHYWLSMQNAIAMTATITVELTSRFPEEKDEITAHHNSILGRLRDADYRIRKELDALENRKMVTLHGAWYYFAEEYGLEVIATFEPSPGREPTPQQLAELGKAAAAAGVRTVYSEPQLSAETVESFVRDNGLGIAVLDPLGGTEGRESYIDMMLYNASTIAENQ